LSDVSIELLDGRTIVGTSCICLLSPSPHSGHQYK